MDVTWAAEGPGDDGDAYDAFVLAAPAGHVHQTRAWAAVARAGAHVAARFAVVRDAGRVVGAALVLRPTMGVALPWAWIDRGPVVDDIERLGAVTSAIGRALRRRGVARLRVMPYWSGDDAARAEAALRAIGLRDVQEAAGAHGCTLRVAVGGRTDDAIFAGKPMEQVRWRARQAARAGAVARRGTGDDWARLEAMHGALMRAQGRGAKPAAWWRALARFASDDARGALFACDAGARTVAAAVALRHGPLATYAWGASVPDKLPFSKAVPPLLAAIRWARDAGCATFDLGGIPAEDDRDPKRNAIATFKRDFGEDRVRLVHAHAGWC